MTVSSIACRVVAMLGFLARASMAGDSDSNIVLEPLPGTESLPEKMLIFMPGGLVPNAKYVATAKAIQKATTGLRLWVAIPAVYQRLCIISCTATSICAPLHKAVESTLTLAVGKGWKRGKDDEDTYLAGHSLGGTCANTLFQAYSNSKGSPYAALLIMGGYVDESGSFDLTHYPKPVLTLNVELDGGLARPGKTATWWRQHEELTKSRGEALALAEKPVIVLQKMNHSDFCPGFDVPGDLMAEVDQATATETAAEVLAAFLHNLAGHDKEKSIALIKEKVAWTRELLTPYLKAQDMERTPTDTTVSEEGAGPFCAEMQKMTAGLSGADAKRLSVSDSFHISKPNLEHCHPNYTHSGDDLKVMSCSHTDYYLDVANTGKLTAASQIACKMLSSDRVAEQLKVTAADSTVTCKAGNKRAVEIAEGLAAKSTSDRFKKSGRGWCFDDDVETLSDIGPVWVFKDALTLKETPECMKVASPFIKTQIDGKIYPGNFYCKFLSPARVLDWMMTDGLKHPKDTTELIV